MTKGLDELKELREYWLNHLPLSVKDGLRIVKVLEKELKAGEIAIDFIDHIASLFKEHDLEELEDEIIKTKEALEIVRKAFNSSSTYTNKLKDSLECGWITQEEYELLNDVINRKS